ncbi:hypothetical protein [Aromatoleum diolicum]|uniref:Uncharacterized protein n=1 Tax=Aromatoleum diolicum TaxID=75796 RepID=A0ABX1Q602_9RHOO|nr:hypothetical protein [Aromatoleum diolicum]NMG73792.1 hypothetical protein [Aromatoleum diolicum]
MASFLLDALNWPDDAGPFRITNLALHLCNGLLIYLLVSRIVAIASPISRSAAFWISALWLVNPAHTATTLYVVQRMTLLSTFFMLVGLIAYVAGRHRYYEEKRAGIGLMLGGLAVGAIIGSLAKENAATLPLIVLAFEFTIFGANAATPFIRAWRVTMLAPYFVLLATHLIPWSKYVDSFAWQPFTWWERILTQPLVVGTYVKNTLAPSAQKIGIFNDQFSVVSNIFSEPVALFSLVAVGLAFALAIRVRRKYPVAALCVLSFFACHALESSIFPLELYFEHRNYLASAAVIALAYMLLVSGLPSLKPGAKAAAGIGTLAASAFITSGIAAPWGDPTLGAIVWTSHFPDSVRARLMAAATWSRQGQFVQAERELTEGFRRNPSYLALRLQALKMRCMAGEDVTEQLMAVRQSARSAIIERLSLDTLTYLQGLAQSGECSGLTIEAINDVASQLIQNPQINKAEFLGAYVWFIIGETSSDLGRLDAAFEAMDKVEAYRGDTRTAFWKAVWSINNGNPERANEVLSQTRTGTQGNTTEDGKSREAVVIERIINANNSTSPNFSIVVDPVKLEQGAANIEIRPRGDKQNRIVVAQ